MELIGSLLPFSFSDPPASKLVFGTLQPLQLVQRNVFLDTSSLTKGAISSSSRWHDWITTSRRRPTLGWWESQSWRLSSTQVTQLRLLAGPVAAWFPNSFSSQRLQTHSTSSRWRDRRSQSSWKRPSIELRYFGVAARSWDSLIRLGLQESIGQRMFDVCLQGQLPDGHDLLSPADKVLVSYFESPLMYVVAKWQVDWSSDISRTSLETLLKRFMGTFRIMNMFLLLLTKNSGVWFPKYSFKRRPIP